MDNDSLSTDQQRRLLLNHLTGPRRVGNATRLSGFTAARGDARLVTNRDAEGRRIPGKTHCCWLGAVGYMALLDQIGTCFKPKGRERIEGTTINKSLSYFTDLNSPDIEAVYALRCALAHDYALVNVHASRPDRTHRFSLKPLEGSTVVKLPKKQWNGKHKDSDLEATTVIDVVSFGDLVEDICQKVVSAARAGELDIELEGGYEELELRYTFVAEA